MISVKVTGKKSEYNATNKKVAAHWPLHRTANQCGPAACSTLRGSGRPSERATLLLWVPLVAPVAFTVFVLIYTVDRWLLVRKRAYPLVRAFVQVGVTLVFLTSLMQRQAVEYKAATEKQAAPEATSSLLKHREARVRAAACELLSMRGELKHYATIEMLSLGDKSPVVQERCAKALETLRAVGQKAPEKPPIARQRPIETLESQSRFRIENDSR